jgi:hypothetical protein
VIRTFAFAAFTIGPPGTGAFDTETATDSLDTDDETELAETATELGEALAMFE